MRKTNHTHDIDAHLTRVSEKQESQRQWELQHNTAVRNAPHSSGTVSELAVALGVSKSEVRRLKREGQLEAALIALPTIKEP